MQRTIKFPRARNLSNNKEAMNIMANHIRQKASLNGALNILEAGCGRQWGLDLQDIQYTLTGVDIDKNALDIRRNQRRDLDIAILADLRIACLESNSYDVILSKYVLEHIDGAEDVLKNFIRWLKPGGIMILTFPNRDSVYAYLTRITPFWFHVFYKKHIQKVKSAGKPGHDPYPTVFDKVVSRNGIYEFCEKHGLIMKAEYRLDRRTTKSQMVWFLAKTLIWILHLVSFKKLSVSYRGLLCIIEKP